MSLNCCFESSSLVSSNTLALQYILVGWLVVGCSMGRLTLHCLLVSISLVECSMVNIIWLTLQRFLVSSSLMGSNTLTALLLVSWATVTRPATRGGGR